MNYKVVKEKVVFKGKFISVNCDQVILPSGREVSREVIHYPGSAAIIAFLDKETIIMLRHFRYPVHDWLWEIPAGTLEPPEEPIDCAARELEEETGYVAGKLTPLAVYLPSPGISDELMHLYRADDLTRTRQNLEFDEVLTVVPMTVKELRGKFKSGKLVDGKTQYALKMCGII